MKHKCNNLMLALVILLTLPASATEKVVPIRYGNMDNWTIRKIEESAIIGGQTKTLYEIGPSRTISGNKPYVNGGGSGG